MNVVFPLKDLLEHRSKRAISYLDLLLPGLGEAMQEVGYDLSDTDIYQMVNETCSQVMSGVRDSSPIETTMLVQECQEMMKDIHERIYVTINNFTLTDSFISGICFIRTIGLDAVFWIETTQIKNPCNEVFLNNWPSRCVS